MAGIETYACAECLGGELGDDIDDLEDEIDRLLELGETVNQWAHICALEAAIFEARAA